MGTNHVAAVGQPILEYRPAVENGWPTIVIGSRVLSVEPSARAITDAAWRALGDDTGFRAAVDLLTREGLSATPAFALLEWVDGDVRAIVRGGVELTVIDRVGTHVLGGADVSTWTERRFPGVISVTLTVTGVTAAEGQGPYPLVAGVALVSGFHVADVGAAPVVPLAVPSVEPVTTPVTEATVTAVPEQASDDTIVRTIGGAAEDGATDENVDSIAGDHDGQTMLASDIAKLRAEPAIAGDHDGHTVLTSEIAKLRSGVPRAVQPTTTSEKPAVLRLVLELQTGIREPLAGIILLGRAPSVSQVSGDRMPRLVTVGGADQDISRTHARVALEGDTVVVTDMHSRNGTSVVLPGKEAQKLRAGEPTAVIVGTVVDLGGGVSFTIGEE